MNEEPRKRRDGMLVRTGRWLVAGIFIQGGYQALRHPEPRSEKAATLPLPMDPEQAVRFNAAAMMVGGAAFGLGIAPRLAATGLFASLAITTAAGHQFWNEETDQARRTQQTQFFKNIAIMGGLLFYLSRKRR
jgi:putative oxidoreductase